MNEAPVFSISQSNITGVIDIPLPTINVSIISGAVTSFSISPALPLGLVFNTTSGSISGTPTQASTSKEYTISGINSEGIGTLTLSLFIDGDLDGDGLGDTTDLDIDGDGVSNRIEVLDGTNPKDLCDYELSSQILSEATQTWLNLDCDGDGVINSQELIDGTDPTDPCSSNPQSITLPLSQLFLDGDCDGDGLSNGEELGLNPMLPTDVDNNGTPDYLEFNNHSQSEDDLEIFNSMTTNGDALNDVFVIRGIENYPDNNLYIYNRWGVEVYNVEGYGQDNKYFTGISQGRNTFSQSAELPKGTYYFILRYKNKQGIDKQRSGYLYITK